MAPIQRLHSMLLVVAGVVLFVGCSASGPIYEPASPSLGPDAAVVDIYRPDRFLAGGIYYRVYIDSQKIVNLKNNGYTRVVLPPGQHTVSLGVWCPPLWMAPVFSSALSFEARAGEPCTIRVSPGFFYATLREESTGSTDIKQTRYLEPARERL